MIATTHLNDASFLVPSSERNEFELGVAIDDA